MVSVSPAFSVPACASAIHRPQLQRGAVQSQRGIARRDAQQLDGLAGRATDAQFLAVEDAVAPLFAAIGTLLYLA